jgi:hypothetical protein
MLNFKLTSYNPNATYPAFRFYVLNKGLNSGKPLLEPCPNCFVCICNSDAEKENLYWLLFALWQGKRFHQELIGSVIPYIRKKEMTNLIKSAILKNENRPEVMDKAIIMLQNIESSMKKYQDLTMKLKQLKYALVRDLV